MSNPTADVVFVAHPAGLEEVQMEALRRAVTSVFPATRFVFGQDDFQERLQAEGGWDGWCRSVATGRHYQGLFLVPRFTHLLVMPEARIGKATASIVQQALHAHKPVYFWDGQSQVPLVRVTRLVTWDSEDFKTGWEVCGG